MLTDTVCVALSAGGLGIALMTAYRRRFLAATRITAYALIPIGLNLTGILDWITDLVFHPSVWFGFVLLGLAWLLLVMTRAVERRREGEPDGKTGTRDALAARASAPSLEGERGGGRSPGRGKAKKPSKGTGGDDFSDIEAILKKHGI